MAASSSVLGCWNGGAFPAILSPLRLYRAPSAPSGRNFFGAGAIPFVSFMAALINSRLDRPADAMILRLRAGVDFFFAFVPPLFDGKLRERCRLVTRVILRLGRMAIWGSKCSADSHECPSLTFSYEVDVVRLVAVSLRESSCRS